MKSPRIAAVHPDNAEDFKAEVVRSGTPIVEPSDEPDHCLVTFVTFGQPETLVLLHTVTDKDRDDLSPHVTSLIPGTDVSYRTYRLRSDHRASYQLLPNAREFFGEELKADRAGWRRALGAAVPDPLNPDRFPSVRDGEAESSLLELPEAPVPPGDPEPAPGTVSHMQIGGRDVWVHTPAMPPPPEGFAVLVLLDGEVWAERLDFGRTLDALAATGLTPPLLTAMVATGGERHTDYACSDTYTAFLTKELLPYIGQRFPITEAPEKTVIAGQSFGGLCAAYVAFSVPERFGAALVQSGSFWWGPDGEDSEWLTHQLAGDPGARFHLQVGVQEWMLSGPVERFREALDKHSCSYTHTEYNGGHDYAVWRAGLPIGLVDLLR